MLKDKGCPYDFRESFLSLRVNYIFLLSMNGANVTIRPQGVGVDKGRIKVFGMWETYAPFF